MANLTYTTLDIPDVIYPSDNKLMIPTLDINMQATEAALPFVAWGSVKRKDLRSCGATDPAERQQLRNEIDAIVAHLYGLSREDFDHILGTFPLVFPDTDDGRAKRAALLAEYERWGDLS